jgi:hypothetical protein
VRAAQTLERAFQMRGGCHVEHVDAINYVSKLFQRLYDDAYIALVRNHGASSGGTDNRRRCSGAATLKQSFLRSERTHHRREFEFRDHETQHATHRCG